MPEICKAYMMGKCKNVDACHYFHPAPCKYYLQNSCRESEDTCNYAHLSKKIIGSNGIAFTKPEFKVFIQEPPRVPQKESRSPNEKNLAADTKTQEGKAF